MLLQIRYYGDKILRVKCKPVEKITDEIRILVANMIETMDAAKGAGLAAPQVGHDLRIFVLRNYIEMPEGDLSLSDPMVYINPILSNPSHEKDSDTEGCLSIPGLRAEVDRPLKIRVEAMGIDGVPFIEEVEGYNARVRMHENDHLNGVLYIDRLNLRARKKLEPALKEIQKKYHPST
jgi:peptide deformylase